MILPFRRVMAGSGNDQTSNFVLRHHGFIKARAGVGTSRLPVWMLNPFARQVSEAQRVTTSEFLRVSCSQSNHLPERSSAPTKEGTFSLFKSQIACTTCRARVSSKSLLGVHARMMNAGTCGRKFRAANPCPASPSKTGSGCAGGSVKPLEDVADLDHAVSHEAVGVHLIVHTVHKQYLKLILTQRIKDRISQIFL